MFSPLSYLFLPNLHSACAFSKEIVLTLSRRLPNFRTFYTRVMLTTHNRQFEALEAGIYERSNQNSRKEYNI